MPPKKLAGRAVGNMLSKGKVAFRIYTLIDILSALDYTDRFRLYRRKFFIRERVGFGRR